LSLQELKSCSSPFWIQQPFLTHQCIIVYFSRLIYIYTLLVQVRICSISWLSSNTSPTNPVILSTYCIEHQTISGADSVFLKLNYLCVHTKQLFNHQITDKFADNFLINVYREHKLSHWLKSYVFRLWRIRCLIWPYTMSAF
jgi:hypothetical protein